MSKVIVEFDWYKVNENWWSLRTTLGQVAIAEVTFNPATSLWIYEIHNENNDGAPQFSKIESIMLYVEGIVGATRTDSAGGER